jgi:hypothetical protein
LKSTYSIMALVDEKINNYKKLIESEQKMRGEDLYISNGVKKIYSDGSTYCAKVVGNYKPYYKVTISNDNVNCTCDDCEYCEHIYAVLLSIESNDKITNISKFEILKMLTKNQILSFLEKNFIKNPKLLDEVLDGIKIPVINKDSDNSDDSNSNSDSDCSDDSDCQVINLDTDIEMKIGILLEDVDYNFDEFKYNENYEYFSGIFDDYDNQLVELLRRDNTKTHNDVIKKIISYNRKMDKMGFERIFGKTLKYLENNGQHKKTCVINKIIELFNTNQDLAIKRLGTITKMNDLLEITNNLTDVDINGDANINLVEKIFLSIDTICPKIMLSPNNEITMLKWLVSN